MTPDALATEVSALLAKRVPATVNAVSQPIEMRVNDLVAGVRSDVAVKIYGDDLHAMSGAADAIRNENVASLPAKGGCVPAGATLRPARLWWQRCIATQPLAASTNVSTSARLLP
jgi:hypothetical protein